jgi:hypothetical protein
MELDEEVVQLVSRVLKEFGMEAYMDASRRARVQARAEHGDIMLPQRVMEPYMKEELLKLLTGIRF